LDLLIIYGLSERFSSFLLLRLTLAQTSLLNPIVSSQDDLRRVEAVKGIALLPLVS
jgi:hypothetical protein